MRTPAHVRAPVAVLALVAGLLAVAQPAPAQSPGITVAPPAGDFVKLYFGRTLTYTVVLNTRPSTTVTVTISPGPVDYTTQITADTDPDTPGDQNVLTFFPSNWSTTQTVTITGGRTDESFALRNFTHTAGGNDTDYPSTMTAPSATFYLLPFDGQLSTGSQSSLVGAQDERVGFRCIA